MVEHCLRGQGQLWCEPEARGAKGPPSSAEAQLTRVEPRCALILSHLRAHTLWGLGGGVGWPGVFSSILPACSRAQQRGAWDLGHGAGSPSPQVVSVATRVAGSTFKDGPGAGDNLVGGMQAGQGQAEWKGQALSASCAPVFPEKAGSSCIGRIFANVDLGLIVISRASTGSP